MHQLCALCGLKIPTLIRCPNVRRLLRGGSALRRFWEGERGWWGEWVCSGAKLEQLEAGNARTLLNGRSTRIHLRIPRQARDYDGHSTRIPNYQSQCYSLTANNQCAKTPVFTQSFRETELYTNQQSNNPTVLQSQISNSTSKGFPPYTLLVTRYTLNITPPSQNSLLFKSIPNV